MLFTSSSKHFMSIGILYHVFIVQIQSWGRFEFVFEKGSEILSENSWKLYFDFLNPSFATDQWVSWISPAPSSPRDTRPLPARLSLDLSPPPLAPTCTPARHRREPPRFSGAFLLLGCSLAPLLLLPSL